MYRAIALVILITGIVGSIWYKISSLESKIDELNAVISKKISVIKEQDATIGSYKTIIKLKDSDIRDLTSNIEKQNLAIEKLKVRQNNEYDKWIKKSAADRKRYVKDMIANNIRHMNETKKLKAMIDVDYSKATCEQGINLNKAISRINYDD